MIADKDRTISELNARVHRSEEKISQKDLEIHTIRKQQENLAFQLQVAERTAREPATVLFVCHKQKPLVECDRGT